MLPNYKADCRYFGLKTIKKKETQMHSETNILDFIDYEDLPYNFDDCEVIDPELMVIIC